MNELKYCKFCDKEKPIKDFAKSGFAIKNICRECQNKKNNQIYKNSKKIEKLEEETQKEEKEFAEIDFNKRALRAEKMFKMNQKELMRYYDMNLAQTKFLSGLGIMMIIFGIVIVVVSLVMYVYTDADKTLLTVGNISGILINFVGAVFIRMYTHNVEAAVKFHAKFAESNNLLLANSIANKIEDEKLREETLSEIAKDIIVYNNTISD